MKNISTESKIKNQLSQEFKDRYFLRLHVTVILLWTFCVGLLVTKLLLMFNIDSMLIRYLLALLFAYLAFLLAVRVWLWYVGLEECLDRKKEDDFDLEPPEVYGENERSSHNADNDISLGEAPSSEIGAGMGDLVGAAVEAEGAGIVLLVVAIIIGVLASVFVVGIFIVLETPVVLVEAAFEALLAGGLIKIARQWDQADWMGAVIRMTYKKFLIVVALTIAFVGFAHIYKPEARTIVEVFSK